MYHEYRLDSSRNIRISMFAHNKDIPYETRVFIPRSYEPIALPSEKAQPLTETNLSINISSSYNGRLCCLVIRAPGYRTEMYCVSCEV
jgi:hypothetical protein